MKEYKVVLGRNTSEIEKNVNFWLKYNYECVGGISVVPYGNDCVYHQAMIREE